MKAKNHILNNFKNTIKEVILFLLGILRPIYDTYYFPLFWDKDNYNQLHFRWDRIKHFTVGCLIQLAVFCIYMFLFNPNDNWGALMLIQAYGLAWLASYLVGYVKEYIDEKRGKGFDPKDAMATAYIGGFVLYGALMLINFVLAGYYSNLYRKS